MSTIAYSGRILILGFGSVGQGVLPLLVKHLNVPRDRISIIAADDGGMEEARGFGISFSVRPLTEETYAGYLDSALSRGDFLLNVSVDVSSVALMTWCQQHGVLYLDTCIEPWAGGYTDTRLSPSQRSNYALRESALALRKKFPHGPTAIVTHGANPGLISHLIKQAIVNIARDTGVLVSVPKTKLEWATLARDLNVKVIHVAERDTQVGHPPKRVGEFVNTWSVPGFVGEGCQPCELGWGSHERHFPADGKRHEFGGGAAIYLQRPGASVRVRSWTPLEGPYHGFIITHGESISVADYFTLNEDGKVYRPTVHYAYHPCDAAVSSLHELAGKNWKFQERWRVMREGIDSGVDELGALVMGHKKNAYWFGSVLSIEEAKKLAPYNNATSLQVAATVTAGVMWAIENPHEGVTEPDEMPFDRILDIARPYLGKLTGAYTDWTPLKDRGILFKEDVDETDPWQFKNFRVV
ncbi:MAG: homospermidine synthase [Burkholderiales bacterium]